MGRTRKLISRIVKATFRASMKERLGVVLYSEHEGSEYQMRIISNEEKFRMVEEYHKYGTISVRDIDSPGALHVMVVEPTEILFFDFDSRYLKLLGSIEYDSSEEVPDVMPEIDFKYRSDQRRKEESDSWRFYQ